MNSGRELPLSECFITAIPLAPPVLQFFLASPPSIHNKNNPTIIKYNMYHISPLIIRTAKTKKKPIGFFSLFMLVFNCFLLHCGIDGSSCVLCLVSCVLCLVWISLAASDLAASGNESGFSFLFLSFISISQLAGREEGYRPGVVDEVLDILSDTGVYVGHGQSVIIS